MMIRVFSRSEGHRFLFATGFFQCLLIFLLATAALFIRALDVQAEGLHPEAFAATVGSRSGNEIGLNTEPGIEFGRQEELWVYQKRDAIQIGGVTVKVNWARIGKMRIVSFDAESATAMIVEEDPDSAIDVGNEVGRLPNTPPRIISIESDSLKIRPKHEVNIFVRAEDDEGDTLIYFAQAADGKLLHSGDQSPVMQWVAPEGAGAYEIAIRVSDEKGGIVHGKIVIEALPVSAKDPYTLAGVIGGDRDDAWQLGAATDIDTDERDNMWVVDGEKKLLRITSPTGAELGAIDLKYGRSAFGVAPSSLCFTDEGLIHVLDVSHKALDRLDKKGKSLDSVFDNSNRKGFLLESPSDIESTENGDVLVTDFAAGHVVTIDKNGRFVLLFAGQGTGNGQLLSPVSISTNEYGDIYVLDAGKGEIVKFDRHFRFHASYRCPLEGLTGKILVDTRSDSIFILDGTTGSVRKLEDDGKLKPLIAPIVGEDLSGPSATSMAVRSSGHILIGTENASIWEFDANGNLRGILGEENIGNVPSIAATDDGDLFVLDSSAIQVKRFDRHRWLIARFGEKGMYEGQFQVPARICVDGEGNSYVFDSRKRCIQRFTATGVFDKLLPVGEEVAGSLNDAVDIYIMRDGTLFVLDEKRKAVFILSRDGELLKIVPFTASGSRSSKQIKRPVDVAVDEEGTIYVSDPSQYAVHKFDAEGKRIGELGGKGQEAGQFGKIVDLAVDGRGFVYVLLKDRRVVATFDKDGKFIMEIPLAIGDNTSLKSPEVITVDSFGSLYVYDGYYRAVFKFMH